MPKNMNFAKMTKKKYGHARRQKKELRFAATARTPNHKNAWTSKVAVRRDERSAHDFRGW
jgi:hypothetical protein